MHFDWSSDCDMEGMTALCTANYLNEKTTVAINGKKVTFELEHSHTENGHFILKMEGGIDDAEVETIEISNQCFWEFHGKFKNRVILDIADFSGSYLLKKRKNYIRLE